MILVPNPSGRNYIKLNETKKFFLTGFGGVVMILGSVLSVLTTIDG